MEIKFVGKDSKEFTVALKDEEAQYLIEYAFADLIKKGLISLEDASEEDAQMDYLKNCDVNHIPRT